MIRLLLCDGDGSILFDQDLNQTKNLINYLDRSAIVLGVVTNNYTGEIERNFIERGLRRPDLIISRYSIGERKPSPAFIEEATKITGFKRNEIAYIGDDDFTDALCALNSSVLPLTAMYSNSGKSMNYGLPMNSIDDLIEFIDWYGKQPEPFFGWQCNVPEKKILTYSLIGQHKQIGLTQPLQRIFKFDEEVVSSRNNVSLSTVILYYLISQIFLSGLIKHVDVVTVYPGSQIGKVNHLLADYSRMFKKIFIKRSYYEDLLIRHTSAKKSTNTSGDKREIIDQLSTVHVNPKYEDLIQKKKILVLDDFTTSGNSLETSRILLLKAGCSTVTSIAIAKYRNSYNFSTVLKDDWDPFSPLTITKEEIVTTPINGFFNKTADDYLQNNILNHY